MKILTVTRSGLPHIPEGKYPATFSGYEEMGQLRFGDTLKLKFTISDGPYKETVLDCLARLKVSPKTKLGGILSSLLGEQVKIGTDIDMDSLVGLPCSIVVASVNGNSGDFSTVAEVERG